MKLNENELIFSEEVYGQPPIRLLRVSHPIKKCLILFETVQLMNVVFCKMTDIITQKNLFHANFLF